MSTEQPNPQIMHERLLFGGVTALLSVLGLAVPAFLYLAPIPLGVLTYRQGMQVGTITAVVSGLVTGVFVNEIGLLMVILLLALGLTLGGGLREGMKPATALGFGTIVALIVFAVLFFTAQRLFSVHLVDEIFAQWQALLGPDFEEMLAAVRLVFPAMMVMSAVMITFVNMFGIHRVLHRMGVQTLWFPPFRLWRLPLAFGLAYIVVQLALFFVESGVLGVILGNLQAILFYLFIVHGLAVVTFFCRQWGFHWAVTGLVFFFAVMTPLGHQLLVLLGVVDTVVNVRRIDKSTRLE